MPYLAAISPGRVSKGGQGEGVRKVECSDADWKTTVARLPANKLWAIYTAAASKGLPGFLFPHHLQIVQVLNYTVCGQTVIFMVSPQ